MRARKLFLLSISRVIRLLVLVTWSLGTACGAHAARPADDRPILGSWYCESSDVYQRFDFAPDGTLMWLSYIPLKGAMRFWSQNYSDGGKYTFKSATEIQVTPGVGSIFIRSLDKDTFTFHWNNTAFSCGRTPPPGDTAASRAAASAELENEKRAFFGRWMAIDSKRSVEFLPNDSCVTGALKAGRWATTRTKSQVLHEGRDAMCGNSGIYSRKTADTIILDYGMGGTPEIFRRTAIPANQTNK